MKKHAKNQFKTQSGKQDHDECNKMQPFGTSFSVVSALHDAQALAGKAVAQMGGGRTSKMRSNPESLLFNPLTFIVSQVASRQLEGIGLRLKVGLGFILLLSVLGCAGADCSAGRGVAPGGALTGRVVFLRGGVFGIFSSGFDSLATDLQRRGLQVSVHPHDEWKSLANDLKGNTRIILIGHSWGADDAVRLARELETSQQKVELFIAIDPTEAQSNLPKNIGKTVDLYQSNGAWYRYPWFRGQKYEDIAAINLNLWDDTDAGRKYPDLCHWNLTEQESVRSEVVALIEEACRVKP